jgi:hypothetical protein
MPMQHAGAEGRAALADLALRRAGTHGLTTVATVQVFADHMVYLGACWDEDPVLEPISAPLAEHDLSPIQRMDAVHAAARAWMIQTRGGLPNAPLLFEAAARAHAWLQWRNSDTDLRDLLPRIAPEKALVAAADALDRFITASQARAQAHGLPPGRGSDAAVVAAWLGGVGVLDDPLYHRGALATAPGAAAREQMMIDLLRDALNKILASGRAVARA